MAARRLLCPRQGSSLVSRATNGCTFTKPQSMSMSMTPTVYRQLQKQSRRCGACSMTFPGVNHKTALHTGSSSDAAKQSQKTSQCDRIGPPDTDSNLRPIKFHIPANESPAEKRLRELRDDTQKWNQHFWAQHNRNFAKQKEAFVETKLRELKRQNPGDAERRLTAEELSMFYKQFLDDNYKYHRQYNREWYRRNIGMLWPAMRVSVQRLLKLNG